MDIPAETKTQIQQRIEEVRKRYPEAQAACLPALYVAQDHLNYISDEALAVVAESLGLPQAFVQGVATFYTMYYSKPVGTYHLQLCTNVSCMLSGAETVLDGLAEYLGINKGETTSDGLFTLSEVECLAACGSGPVLQVNNRYYEHVDLEKAKRIVDELRAQGAKAPASEEAPAPNAAPPA